MRAAALTLFLGFASPAFAASEAATEAGSSVAQFQLQFRQRLMAADRDHDGKLSEAELVAAKGEKSGSRGNPARLFKRLDTNGDGMLDAAEIDTMSARRFARLDTNSDGRVSTEERRTARSAMAGGGPRGRGLGWGRGANGEGTGDGSSPGKRPAGLEGLPGD